VEIRNDIETMFLSYNDELEQNEKHREEIHKELRELARVNRNIQCILQKVQTTCDDEEGTHQLCESARPHFIELKDLWVRLANTFGTESPQKYHGSWKGTLANLVYLAALSHFLENGTLITIEETSTMLGVSKPFDLDVEDYLHGVCGLPRELARLCVNCVRNENYQLPIKISRFVSSLYSGLRLLNLRNDPLRRKFDGLKYDLQKIEEVMYDITLRKLIPKDSRRDDTMLSSVATLSDSTSSYTSNSSVETRESGDSESRDESSVVV